MITHALGVLLVIGALVGSFVLVLLWMALADLIMWWDDDADR